MIMMMMMTQLSSHLPRQLWSTLNWFQTAFYEFAQMKWRTVPMLMWSATDDEPHCGVMSADQTCWWWPYKATCRWWQRGHL